MTDLCPRCHEPLRLDAELTRASLDAGWPAVELLVCLNGHSLRADAPQLQRGPLLPAPTRLCAVCGQAVERQKGLARKYCSAACSNFVAKERSLAHYRGEIFELEAQAWYQGRRRVVEASVPLPPLDPLAGRIPREWAAGWLRVHGGELAEPAA